MNIEDLNEALDTLEERLSDGSKASEVVIDTADEYGLRPELLNRKFEELHGLSVDNYQRPTSLVTLARRKARKDALDSAWQTGDGLYFGITEPYDPEEIQKRKTDWMQAAPIGGMVGAIFSFNGDEYAFVKFTRCVDGFMICGIPVLKQKTNDELSWRLGNSKLRFETQKEGFEYLEVNTLVHAGEVLE